MHCILKTGEKIRYFISGQKVQAAGDVDQVFPFKVSFFFSFCFSIYVHFKLNKRKKTAISKRGCII